ncbi:Argininosuccinate lyase (plasmid) [Variovorax sp. SRS16]|uniref:Bug family tripartite tricarboxylate transporter substrate binding protein n=1 Tax=Variovorax sp. SRS16 TaxID=282217 RepID=UPI001316BA5F|nr:tripartite tricarboxylate transporter substrate binding protein [Variovorax sp. SRS16]VTU45598.1 Argininosuccinate lyase [Variovorax sp. SRS16]
MIRYLTALVAGLALALPAAAQDYPTKPIKIIVASAAGGASDILSRLVAEKMSVAYGQPVLVEAKPGANGNIAAEFVAAAPPDGYTLMMGTIGALAINASMYKNVRYDPLKDFAPVARLVSFSNLLVVKSALPVHNVKELIAYAKAHPNELHFGSPGAGGSPHMSMVQFAQMAHLQMVHVPYKGAAPTLTDLMGGYIDLAFSDPLLTQPHLQGGRIRALAVSGSRRLPSLPNIPTVAEAGVPGYEVSGWLGIAAPANTPPAIVAKLNKTLNEAMAMPDMQAKMKDMGAEVITTTPAEFGTFMASEFTRWKKVIVEGNLVAD